MNNPTEVERGLFGICFHIIGHHQRESGQELKQGKDPLAGTDAEATDGCRGVLLTDLLSGIFNLLFIEPNTTHNRLGLLKPIAN